MKDIYNKFKALAKMNVTDIAKKSGISRSYVSTGINNSDVVSKKLTGSIYLWMEKVLKEQQEEMNKKYDELLNEIKSKGETTNEESKN